MLNPDEIDALMAEHITKAVEVAGDVTPAVAAHALAEELRDSNPELLVAWVDQHAEAFLADLIRSRIRAVRSKNRSQVSARRFSEAAREFGETGDKQKFLSSFDVRYAVDDSNTQRRVGDMTGADHKYVAGRYDVTAKKLKLLSQFHRAVAKELGARKVSDVYTEIQYDAMYRSLVGSDPARVDGSE